MFANMPFLHPKNMQQKGTFKSTIFFDKLKNKKARISGILFLRVLAK